MPIPNYQAIMLPLLKLLIEKPDLSTLETVEALAKTFNLSPQEKRKELPSGKRTVFYDRVSWATKYLMHAGLIERPRRGHYSVSELGIKVLKKNPKKIDLKYLQQFPGFWGYIAAAYPGGMKGRNASSKQR